MCSGVPSFNLSNLPELNVSYCQWLSDFLSNNETATYDWKDALANVDRLVNMTYEYSRVRWILFVPFY
jgi:hypothetical protein